jgi:hypothetical protein
LSAKLRDVDHGADALLKRTQAAASRKLVKVGVFAGEARNDDEVTNVDVAAFAEFGTSMAPARPWLSGWYDEELAENREALSRIGQAVIKGKLASVDAGLERFGLLARGRIQLRIKAGIGPPNTPRTVAAKGSSTPLIDSGQFWGSISYQVEK